MQVMPTVGLRKIRIVIFRLPRTQVLIKWFLPRVIEDGSFLRLKTLTLGYTLPKKVIKKWGIGNARVYVAGQNLWTISGYSGYDPEVSIRNGALTPGLDYSAYPRAYAINFGVNLGF